jgi:8-oxo-dGTP pyrophosphatase MutT (NUDIX family)
MLGLPPPATRTEMNPRWSPSVTVAAVVEEGGRFLLVEEETPEGLRLNNPAGHLDPGESPLQAVVREALEETARAFTPTALLGVYLSRFVRPATGDDVTYLRFAYRGTVGQALPGRTLDRGIVRTLWLAPDEIRSQAARLRSPLVLRCLDDHLAGRHFPLDLVWADAALAAPPDIR